MQDYGRRRGLMRGGADSGNMDCGDGEGIETKDYGRDGETVLMRGKIRTLVFCILAAVFLTACGTQTRWQKQYDLGMQYLTEGNYEEAVVAFTAAIEIEPNQALAYVGRGGAYIGSGETEANLGAALSDYLRAIELDDMDMGGYIGAADVYIRRGEFDLAEEILQTGFDKTGAEEIQQKIEEIRSGTITDASGKTRMSSHFENGELIQYWLYEYDEAGNNIKTICYKADGSWDNTETKTYDVNGHMTESVEERIHDADAAEEGAGGQAQELWRVRTTYEYDGQGREIRNTRTNLDTGELLGYEIIYYDDVARTKTMDEYSPEDTLIDRFIIEHDENMVRTRGNSYVPDENGELYLDYYVIYLWNADGTYAGFEHYDVAGQEE